MSLHIALDEILEAYKKSNTYINRLLDLMGLFNVSKAQVAKRYHKKYGNNNGATDAKDKKDYFDKMTRRSHVEKDSAEPYITAFMDIVKERYCNLDTKEPINFREHLLSISQYLSIEALAENENYFWLQWKILDNILGYSDGIKIESINTDDDTFEAVLDEAVDRAHEILRENGIKYRFGFRMTDIPLASDLELFEMDRLEDEFYCDKIKENFMVLDLSKCFLLCQNWDSIKRIIRNDDVAELISLLNREPIEALISLRNEIMNKCKESNSMVIEKAISYSYILNISCNPPAIIKASREKMWKTFFKKLKMSAGITIENLCMYFDGVVNINEEILEFLFVYFCTNCDYSVKEGELMIYCPSIGRA